jgi:hypothetical protein
MHEKKLIQYPYGAVVCANFNRVAVFDDLHSLLRADDTGLAELARNNGGMAHNAATAR